MLQTVAKVGPILDLFTAEHPEWGVSEVAEALDAPRSSVHALLASLVSTGLLQTRGRGRYRVGWRIVELNEVLRSGLDLRGVASAPLQDIGRTFRETVQLGVLERGRVLYVDKIKGPQVLTVDGAVLGARLDAHGSAIGKVLLAYDDQHEVDQRLRAAPLRRLTDRTVTDPKELRAQFRDIAQRGFALDTGEIVPGVCCVAAPIRDEHGQVIAAISATVPELRFVSILAELREGIIATARTISASLAQGAEDRAPQER